MTRRFAQREVHGVDDGGAPERIVIWIERKAGAVWAVGRAVNPQHRPSEQPRRDDYVFEGYELEDDVTVSERDGVSLRVRPFLKAEVLRTLERWFFQAR